jgi:hypothetical protein
MSFCRDLQCSVTFFGVLAAAIGVEKSTAAQDDFDEPQRAVPVRTFLIPDQTFDNIVFGNTRGATGAQQRFKTLLEMEIDAVHRACDLSDPQKSKLLLAGQGDIKRYFDKVDEKRRKFQEVKTDMNKFAELQQELQPLRAEMSASIFGANSIFAKTVPKTLSADQAEKYEQVTREKKLFRHRAKIALVIATLDNSLGMTTEQRRNLEKLLVEETQPPRESSQYDFYVILYQATLIPEERLKPIFDETQWKALGPYFNQAKRTADFMKTAGYLPEGVRVPGAKAPGPKPPAVKRQVLEQQAH